MTPTTALAWKEWREIRALLWIALGLFIGAPIIGGVEGLFQYSHHFEMQSTLGWVIPFGSILAIFAAVGATCRDFQPALDDFWRSRPVSVTRWMTMKYVVGIAMVLVACIVPVVLESVVNRDREALAYLLWFPFSWIALYSVGFLAGCLVRRTTHAAMLALAAMVLLYLLPLVIPHLSWLDITNLDLLDTESRRLSDFLPYAGAMIALAIFALTLALLATRWGWRVRSSGKMMYGVIGFSLVFVFAAAAIQLGSNLPILDHADLPPGEEATELHYSGEHGYLITTKFDLRGNMSFVRSIDFGSNHIILGDATKLVDGQFLEGAQYLRRSLEVPAHPRLLYYIKDARTPGVSPFLSLNIVDLANNTTRQVRQLWPFIPDVESYPSLFISNDRLYVIEDRVAVFDISKSDEPRFISIQPLFNSERDASEFHGRVNIRDSFGNMLNEVTFPLLPIAGLSQEERLRATFQRAWSWNIPIVRDHCFFQSSLGGIAMWELNRIVNDTAIFDKTSEYQPTASERLFGEWYSNQLADQNGLIYTDSASGNFGLNGTRYGQEHINVYDTRNIHSIRLVGHFAAPDQFYWGMIQPLADGRAIVGGQRIYLVGPVPR